MSADKYQPVPSGAEGLAMYGVDRRRWNQACERMRTPSKDLMFLLNHEIDLYTAEAASLPLEDPDTPRRLSLVYAKRRAIQSLKNQIFG